MLRCALIALLLAGCSSGAALVPEPAEPETVQTAGAQAAEESGQPVASAAQATDTAPPAEGEIANTVIVESENFAYSMTLRLPDGTPDIRCSYGKRTGSHVQDKYCRTTYDAEREREAAREFFDEARRKGR